MQLDEFKDLHLGEECIVIGNAPSLKNMPVSFLRSRPSMGMNYAAWYKEKMDNFESTYWAALDCGCFENIPRLDPEVPAFIPERFKNHILDNGWDRETNIYYALKDKIPGLGYTKGTRYSSTLIAGIHIMASVMGFKLILVVGFNCERPEATQGFGIGKTSAPHWYDDDGKKGAYQLSWDTQVQWLQKFLEPQGVEILNLSTETMSINLPRADWRDYA